MSFIVKGMNIPELYETYKVNLAMTDDGKIVIGMCPLNETGYRPVGEIVALPDKHGRLVEFIDVVTTLDEDSGTEEVCLGDIMRAYYEMRNAPTIVESEDSE